MYELTNMVFDEKKYTQASAFINRIKIEDARFKLWDIPYALRTCPRLNADGSVNIEGADYLAQPKEWAIYLCKELKRITQLPLLFHEIVEIYHREDGMEQTPAHNAAISLEKRFCEEYLTRSELKQYLEFKKEKGYDGFSLSKP